MNIFDDKFDFLHFVLKSGSCVKGVFKNKKEAPVLLKPIKDERIYYNFEDRDEIAFFGKREKQLPRSSGWQKKVLRTEHVLDNFYQYLGFFSSFLVFVEGVVFLKGIASIIKGFHINETEALNDMGNTAFKSGNFQIHFIGLIWQKKCDVRNTFLTIFTNI